MFPHFQYGTTQRIFQFWSHWCPMLLAALDTAPAHARLSSRRVPRDCGTSVVQHTSRNFEHEQHRTDQFDVKSSNRALIIKFPAASSCYPRFACPVYTQDRAPVHDKRLECRHRSLCTVHQETNPKKCSRVVARLQQNEAHEHKPTDPTPTSQTNEPHAKGCACGAKFHIDRTCFSINAVVDSRKRHCAPACR